MEVQAEPLRIQAVVFEGTPHAIVLLSDHTVFQPPDAEARARAYVDLTRRLDDAREAAEALFEERFLPGDRPETWYCEPCDSREAPSVALITHEPWCLWGKLHKALFGEGDPS